MKEREVCVLLCMFAYVFIGSALVMTDSIPEPTVLTVEETIEEVEEIVEPISAYEVAMGMRRELQLFLDTCPVICNTEPKDLESYSCLMYATEPIGRYYITAYNHLETGSKLTASGKTCHEGTITTCAADPRYHKFGEYLEIDGRLYVVEDTGSAVKKKHIDLYFASYKKMVRYNSNYQQIYKVTWPFGKPKGY